jgi:hypothetical protein
MDGIRLRDCIPQMTWMSEKRAGLQGQFVRLRASRCSVTRSVIRDSPSPSAAEGSLPSCPHPGELGSGQRGGQSLLSGSSQRSGSLPRPGSPFPGTMAARGWWDGIPPAGLRAASAARSACPGGPSLRLFAPKRALKPPGGIEMAIPEPEGKEHPSRSSPGAVLDARSLMKVTGGIAGTASGRPRRVSRRPTANRISPARTPDTAREPS